MNAILSLLVSLAMLLSGAAEMPAVPETATAYTVSNISVTYGGETVELSPEIRLTTSLGTEQANAGFEISMDGQTLLPINARLDNEKITFSLSEDGGAYSVSGETLAEALGLNEDSEAQKIFALIGRIFGLIPTTLEEAQNPEVAAELAGLLTQGAEPEELEIDLDGVTITAQSYTTELSGAGLFAGIDKWLDSENAFLKEYAQLILDVVNLEQETPYATLGEAYAAALEEGMEDFVCPVDYTVGKEGDAAYESIYISAEAGSQTIDMDAQATFSGGRYESNMSFYAGGEEGYDSAYYYAMQDGEGNVEMNFDISSGAISSSMMDDVNYTTEVDTYFNMSLTGETADDGMMDAFFTMDGSGITNFYSDAEDDEGFYSETSFSVSGQESEVLQEDGSVTTDCYYTLSIPGEDLTAELSFQINRAVQPYADAFAGREITEITAADFNSESESASGVSGMLTSDVLGLSSDLLLLSSDEGVIALGELGSAMLEESAADYEDYSDDYYDAEYPESLDEAIAAYGGEIPQIAIPEGYVISYAYGFDGYLSVDYELGEDSFNVTYYPQEDSQTLLLGSDGSLTEAEGVTVDVSRNDDGSIYYATVEVDGVFVQLSNYASGFSIEELQALLAGVA